MSLKISKKKIKGKAFNAVARIRNGKMSKQMVNHSIETGKGLDTFKLEGKNEKLIPLPDFRDGIYDKILCSGVSGSGKSTFISNYIKEYRRKYPDTDLFIFSSVKKDPALDLFDPIRIDMDTYLEDPMVPEDLEDSIVVFDDIATIMDPRTRKAVCALQNNIAECGRHYGIVLLSTTHILFNYGETKKMLNESTLTILFPAAGGRAHIRRFLKETCGLEKPLIEKFFEMGKESRYVAVKRQYAPYFISEREIVLI